jgi:hypothetical protein
LNDTLANFILSEFDYWVIYLIFAHKTYFITVYKIAGIQTERDEQTKLLKSVFNTNFSKNVK